MTSIIDEIHIIIPYLIISFAYEHFQTKLHAIGDAPPNSLKDSNANPFEKIRRRRNWGMLPNS
jgi:hypothetical protein